MTAAIEFTIPACPRSRNRTDQHWALRAKEDERWRELIAIYQPNATFHVPVIVTLTFQAPRAADPDNLSRQVMNCLKTRKILVGRKLVAVRAGLIPDDSPEWVRELRLISRKGPPQTTIRIEPA